MSVASHDNRKQYGTNERLAARARLVTKYTISDIGWFPWIAGQLPLDPGASILDVGCGPGWFWSSAMERLPKDIDLTLTDLSEGMVREALERCTSLPFTSVKGKPADAATLPFAAGTFDGVIAMHMLYHVSDAAKAIAEMHRVLKPGGFLAVTTNGMGDMKTMYEIATVLGSPPYNPTAAIFGFDQANTMLKAQFDNVRMAQHPARLRVTDPEDVFLALTSYPPGDTASEAELSALRGEISRAFAAGNGVLDMEKQFGLFISVKKDG
ncbi:class I SAM-dependent methyltransferase [Allorhizobium sp. BGMRC 0089]|uniref:class I SAM-dependent methyltransferase n=1 Tax=Allorhizobium sonneratiae TaxID=2934936 RepID=UPI002034A3AA|nr:class I SAM-dependent methyltransferase [Allorhizobium sonneratiae]MCM2291273.1 class I SAM-dependent methyltransferase [Allorhizobium sonneratiae]